VGDALSRVGAQVADSGVKVQWDGKGGVVLIVFTTAVVLLTERIVGFSQFV
jgi:hypothetical protein